MAELKIEFSGVDYKSLETGEIGITDFLSKVLPLAIEDVVKPSNELVHRLLSYHSDEGGAVTITRIELDDANYDTDKKVGKVDFNYHLAYHFACSYSDTDYEKNDKVDFSIDTENGVITFVFLDLNTRSTAEEF
ncbi:hypothetical protein [Pedobacter frigoris]|uniref:hypothetical protein n=1 Tax=Pedobacter frigoris TaxID=2571272 RepID=UPI00293117BD|nr:hypothetical protein [Pedobacter frigoris]